MLTWKTLLISMLRPPLRNSCCLYLRQSSPACFWKLTKRTPMSKSYIFQAFIETPWAILHSKLTVLQEIVARHVAGEKLTTEEIETRIHGAARPPDRRIN